MARRAIPTFIDDRPRRSLTGNIPPYGRRQFHPVPGDHEDVRRRDRAARRDARHRPRRVPRAHGRERRGQIHAGQGARGHPPAGQRRTLSSTAHAHVFGSPRDAMDAGRGDGAPGTRLLPGPERGRKPVHGPLPAQVRRLAARPRGRWTHRAESCSRAIGVEPSTCGQPMRDLSTAQEQLVQIAAAVGTNPRILIFDEPTSSLAEPDAQNLFRLIENLKTARHDDRSTSRTACRSFSACATASASCATAHTSARSPKEEMTQDAVVRMMIGRSVADYFPISTTPKRAERWSCACADLASPGKFREVNFEIRRGRDRRVRGAGGRGPQRDGQGHLRARPAGDRRGGARRQAAAGSARCKAAMRAGVGLVPEDRKRQGCVLGMPCRANISMAMLDRLRQSAGCSTGRRKGRSPREYFEQLRVKAASLGGAGAFVERRQPAKDRAGEMAGARREACSSWMNPRAGWTSARRRRIHALIDELAQQGLAVMLISSELPEVINLSTRILVMREGQLAGELTRAEASRKPSCA